MVLSNSKLKRKKREEAAAAAAFSLQSGSDAVPPEDTFKGDIVAANPEKKKKKQKRAKTKIADPDDPSNDVNGLSAQPTVATEAENGLLDGVQGAKQKRDCDGAGSSPREVHEFPPAERNAEDPERSAAGNVASDLVGGQIDDLSKKKVRKKPRWEVDDGGNRVKPAKALDHDFCHMHASTPSVNGVSDSQELKTTFENNGVSLEVAPSVVGNEIRIFEGNEPWLASKRSKKKKPAINKWGKKIDKPVDDSTAFKEEPSSDVNRSEVKIDLKKVMVGGMPYYITENDIHEFFQECGTIAELDCMTFPDTGKFKGIAFITFRTEEAAKRAIALDGADMGGRFLKIEMCKIKPIEAGKKTQFKEPPKKQPGCLAAYIGNLSYDITEKEVRKFFKGCKIESVRFAESKDTGEFRGFGHIDFVDDESLESAMKLDQQPLLGRPLKIAYSVPQKDKIMGVRGGPKPAETKKGCFTCGEEGHMSYNCPQKI